MKQQAYISFLKEGYKIVKSGLDLYGQLKQGDFNLHDLFFMSLNTTKPSVSNYSPVQETLKTAKDINILNSRLNKLLNRAQSNFNIEEASNISFQQNKMLDMLSDDLIDLNNVLKNEETTMSDNERLHRITVIYERVKDKHVWVTTVYNQCSLLDNQRFFAKREVENLKMLHK
ncbi:hypothetical protein [Paraflavitalea sp. CAU 1676]|uniref:hypothetical protein n=1 Tax=Paraflavitalea sp. CAU 1676 TaxID=3032598 RepID=UPI0023D9E87E|nr:hypothetical protein [Paraflavitalea sp. CAU 1676]MDF2190508.1 hypothetical protein [Paraflavitalea sp. CAU 1676]